MAILPDDTALGGLPSSGGRRQIATFDTSGYGRGMAAEAKAVAQAGDAMASGVSDIGKGVSRATAEIGASVHEQNQKVYALQEAQATADYTSKVISLNAARSDDLDENSLKTYPQQHQQVLEQASQGITDPQRREMWLLKRKSDLASQQVETDDRVFEVQKSKAFARAGDQLFDLQRKGMQAKTDADRGRIIQSGHELIDGLENAQYITPEEAAKRRREFANGYAVTTFNAMPAAQRLEAIAPVNINDQSRKAYKFFVDQGYSPVAAAGIAGNLVHESGMNPNSVNPGDGRDGSDSIGIAQWNSDRAVRLKQFAKSIGSSPNDFMTQLRFVDYELKTSEANANNALQAAKTPKEAAAAFLQFERPLGYQAGPQSASGWANRSRQSEAIYADASGTKLPEATGASLLKFMTPEQQAHAQEKAARDFHAGSLDDQRALKLQQAQIKQVSDQTENDVLKDLYSDTPKNSIQSIVNNDKLTEQAKTRLLTQANHALSGDKTDKSYGKGFYDAYQAVHAPEGTPGRITDPTQLYSRVGPNGDLTVQGVDKLVSEINSRKTPEGVAETEMKKQFLATARGQISGTDEGLHIKDPKGDELYLKFLANVLPAYDAGKKAGKAPAALLNPESPDYVGKAITNYKRPMSEWFSDVVHDQPAAATAAATFDPAKVQNLSELVAAYRGGKVSKSVADQLAIDKGWAAPRPTAPSVPVSQ